MKKDAEQSRKKSGLGLSREKIQKIMRIKEE
jgi:hypothetical protein